MRNGMSLSLLLVVLTLLTITLPVFADHDNSGVAVTIQARASGAEVFGDEIWLDLGGVEMISPSTPPSIISECQQLGLLVPDYTAKVLADASNSLPMDSSFDWRQGWRVEIKGYFKPEPSCTLIASHGDSAEIIGPWSNDGPPSGNRNPTVDLVFSQDGRLKIRMDNFSTDSPIAIRALAEDPDGDELTYDWFLDGVAQDIHDEIVDWTQPFEGTHVIKVVVSDGNGGRAEASATFIVGEQPEKPTFLLTVKEGVLLINDQPVSPGEAIEIEDGLVKVELLKGQVVELVQRCKERFKTLLQLVGGGSFEDWFKELNLKSPLEDRGNAVIFMNLFFGAAEVQCNTVSTSSNMMGPHPQSDVQFAPISLTMEQGVVHVNAIDSAIDTAVFTQDATYLSFGRTSFSVGQDAASDQSAVANHSGTVTVQTFGSSASSVNVRPGKMVGVSDGVVSDPVDAPDSPFDGGGSSPSPSADSIAEALDSNNNGVLDEPEVRQGIQFWIMGQTVPGTTQTISDAKMRELIQIWILGSPL